MVVITLLALQINEFVSIKFCLPLYLFEYVNLAIIKTLPQAIVIINFIFCDSPMVPLKEWINFNLLFVIKNKIERKTQVEYAFVSATYDLVNLPNLEIKFKILSHELCLLLFLKTIDFIKITLIYTQKCTQSIFSKISYT